MEKTTSEQLGRIDRVDCDERVRHSPWLTTGEAAKYLNVSPGTLSNWRQAKRGPPWKKADTGMIFYNVHEIDQWLMDQGQR